MVEEELNEDPLGPRHEEGQGGVGGERVGLVPPHREVGGGAGAPQCPPTVAMAQRGDVEAGSRFQMIKPHVFSQIIFEIMFELIKPHGNRRLWFRAHCPLPLVHHKVHHVSELLHRCKVPLPQLDAAWVGCLQQRQDCQESWLHHRAAEVGGGGGMEL